MFSALDRVVLTVDVPEHQLRKGDIGMVVMTHNGLGYEVEFVTLDGETIAVVSLGAGQVRSASPGEIAHARPVDSTLQLPGFGKSNTIHRAVTTIGRQ
jgi:hypothetical protein